MRSEEDELWDLLKAELTKGGLSLPDATKTGDTAKWLQTNLLGAINDGKYTPMIKAQVQQCAILAGQCAVALRPVFSPGSKDVDENLFAAAVWAVKKYQDPHPAPITTLSVVCK